MKEPMIHLRSLVKTPLVSNWIMYVLSAVGTSFLGFVFWTALARTRPPEEIGLASGLLSAAALLAGVANLGFGFALIRYLPGESRGASRCGLMNTSYTLSGITGLIVAVCFILLVDWFAPALGPLLETLAGMVLLVLLVISGAWSTLTDQVLTAYRQGVLLLAKNLLAAGIKIPLALFVLTGAVVGIGQSVALGMLVVIGWVVVTALPRLEPGYRPRSAIAAHVVPRLVSFALPNHLASWLWESPKHLLPILVLNRFGADANAAFYIAWTIAALVYVIGGALSRSLFAEAAHDATAITRYLIKAAATAFAGQALALIGIVLVGRPILALFGEFYAEQSLSSLIILSSAAFGYTVSRLAQTVLRVQGRLTTLTLLSAMPAVGMLGAQVLWPASQPTELAWAWLVVSCVTGIASLLAVLGRAHDGSAGQ